MLYSVQSYGEFTLYEVQPKSSFPNEIRLQIGLHTNLFCKFPNDALAVSTNRSVQLILTFISLSQDANDIRYQQTCWTTGKLSCNLECCGPSLLQQGKNQSIIELASLCGVVHL